MNATIIGKYQSPLMGGAIHTRRSCPAVCRDVMLHKLSTPAALTRQKILTPER